jgi:hypothetical protein
MQVDEQLPVREPVPQQVSGMHSQRGLAYPGHPADRVDRHHPAAPSSVGHRGHDAVQFRVPAGERRRVRGQRVPHPQRSHRRRLAGLQPGQCLPDLPGQMPDCALQPLGLQMGHVMVQLGSQRLQRPAPRPADHDLLHQVTGQRHRERRSRHSQNIR